MSPILISLECDLSCKKITITLSVSISLQGIRLTFTQNKTTPETEEKEEEEKVKAVEEQEEAGVLKERRGCEKKITHLVHMVVFFYL